MSGVLESQFGYLEIFAWTKDFVPSSMKLTKIQCWVRIHSLPMEYWQPKIIFSIVRGIDTPVSLDDRTMNKSRGFFASVLIDIDILFALSNQILVERSGFAFIADIEFEKLLHLALHAK